MMPSSIAGNWKCDVGEGVYLSFVALKPNCIKDRL
jgi:hypothetical protein